MKKISLIAVLLVFLSSCGDREVENVRPQPFHRGHDVEVFAEVPNPVGNIAYADNGDLVYSNHPFFNPENRVMRYDPKANWSSPFPNLDWNTPKPSSDAYLNTVLGIRSDSKGVVWMLDMGFRTDNGAARITPKFVGWNTKTNALEKIYPIPSPASLLTSQLNDFLIDETHNVFIIADEDIGPGGDGTKAALVVVYRDDKTPARRLLEGHYSTVPERDKPIVIDGYQQLNYPGTSNPILVGADGITADKNNEWLYYAPLNGTKVYRIRITDLLDVSLSSEALGAKVETYATGKQNNGSLSMDSAGNLYMTNLETRSIAVVPAGQNKPYTYAAHHKLFWPDGASSNKDGYMYVPATQLYLGAGFNNNTDKTIKPFLIYRFKPLAEGIFGR